MHYKPRACAPGMRIGRDCVDCALQCVGEDNGVPVRGLEKLDPKNVGNDKREDEGGEHDGLLVHVALH